MGLKGAASIAREIGLGVCFLAIYVMDEVMAVAVPGGARCWSLPARFGRQGKHGAEGRDQVLAGDEGKVVAATTAGTRGDGGDGTLPALGSRGRVGLVDCFVCGVRAVADGGCAMAGEVVLWREQGRRQVALLA
ncbi:MAG: hypothetical protein GY832_36555 [Chloroflexi bacterium]|nr:hypothetical protein [Chloroflexota bacterium]